MGYVGRLGLVLALAGCASGDDGREVVYVYAGGPAPAPTTSSPVMSAPKDVSCTQKCGERVCGPDQVCGISCGICAAGSHCTDGLCIKSAEQTATQSMPSMPSRSPTPAPVVTVASPAPRENGETCNLDGDCASGQCGTQENSGERRCYGSRRANESCATTYDCTGGSCVARSASGLDRVCVDAIPICAHNGVDDDCRSLAIALCQVERAQCAGDVATSMSNFNNCVLAGCEAIEMSGGINCANGLANIRAGLFRCP